MMSMKFICTILMFLLAQPFCLFAERAGKNCGVAAKYFKGFRRAPLPFPYQLVDFKGNHRIVLTDYNGSASVLDVDSIGYDYRYIYARDFRGRMYLIHLYDGYTEEYDGERFLPESVRGCICSNSVKMVSAKLVVDSFYPTCQPSSATMYRQEDEFKTRFGRKPSQSPFIPCDVTYFGDVSNRVPFRIVQNFQNSLLCRVVLERIECKEEEGVLVSCRKTGRVRKRSYIGWIEVEKLEFPVELEPQEEIEVCVEVFPERYLANKNQIQDGLFEIKIYARDCGFSTFRLLLRRQQETWEGLTPVNVRQDKLGRAY